MLLSHLSLNTFRNFSKQAFDFQSRVCVVGHNGVGKSNLIEAIRLLSVGKSFKTNRLDEVIQFSQPYFRLVGRFENDTSRTAELFYGTQFEGSPKERRLSVDNSPANSLDYFGQFTSVLFLPSDVELVLGSPQVRRRYLDGIFWQISREFRQDYLRLSKVLRERAAVLNLIRYNRASPDELQPWTQLLRQLTEKFQMQRASYCTYLNTSLEANSSLLERDIHLQAQYQPNTTEAAAAYAAEVKLGQNLVGPHRDELELLFNDRSARQFASRGQARLLVVLLKLSERNYLSQESGTMPMILFDDLASELDGQNYHRLLELFADSKQVITTSVASDESLRQWQQIQLPQ